MHKREKWREWVPFVGEKERMVLEGPYYSLDTYSAKKKNPGWRA